MQMMKMTLSLAMILMPTLSFVEWKIEPQGAKVMSLPADRLGTIAKLPAKAPSYGVTAYLRETGAGIVDKSSAGVLYRKQQPGDEPMAIVQVRNSTPEPDGSYRDYFLRVPPSMRTVREAIAWTFGMAADEYDPLEET